MTRVVLDLCKYGWEALILSLSLLFNHNIDSQRSLNEDFAVMGVFIQCDLRL